MEPPVPSSNEESSVAEAVPPSVDGASDVGDAARAPAGVLDAVRERGARRRRKLPWWLWFALLFSLVPTSMAAAAWILGSRLPVEHEVRVERVFPMEAEVVWEALTDVREFPQWRTQIERIDLLDPGPPGPVWREVWTGSRTEALTLRTERYEKPHLWEIEVIDATDTFSGRWVFELRPAEDGSGTHVSLTERGAIPRVFVRFAMYYLVPDGMAYYPGLWLEEFERHLRKAAGLTESP
jgi:uncharacterized protein YndB with AHSA1/START domain